MARTTTPPPQPAPRPPASLVRRLAEHRHQPHHVARPTWARALALAAFALVLGAALGSMATAPEATAPHKTQAAL